MVRRSQVRSEIVEQHVEIRGLLPRVEALAKQFEEALDDAPELSRRLREAGLALYEKFGAHLDREEELLEPVLRAAGPHGDKLAQHLVREHHEQRELLQYLLTRLQEHPSPTILLARQLHDFASYLRVEMEDEEKTLLAPEILGDSP